MDVSRSFRDQQENSTRKGGEEETDSDGLSDQEGERNRVESEKQNHKKGDKKPRFERPCFRKCSEMKLKP